MFLGYSVEASIGYLPVVDVVADDLLRVDVVEHLPGVHVYGDVHASTLIHVTGIRTIKMNNVHIIVCKCNLIMYQ